MNTPDYTIRPANKADSATIKKMVRSEPLDPSAVDWEYFFVLEIIENGSPVIASIGMVRPVGKGENQVYEVDSVTTRRQYRGRGYAAALVRALMDRAPRPLYLLAETKLVGFYEKLGFQKLEGSDAPPPMRAQARFVNTLFGWHTIYHVMGVISG